MSPDTLCPLKIGQTEGSEEEGRRQEGGLPRQQALLERNPENAREERDTRVQTVRLSWWLDEGQKQEWCCDTHYSHARHSLFESSRVIPR
mmetsp:Transcript_17759/g.42897  ORF Transcript_17759/g.42897 Transcript_17759/m.42897 type:complete len:90 (-) Transcript_17759:156-425(-)